MITKCDVVMIALRLICPDNGGAHLSIDSGFPLSDFRAHKDALKKLSMTTAMINEPDT